MRTGHLFAGIDGIGLGLEPHGFDTAWFSEYEAAPSRVLAHHYPDVPNHGDITAIDWSKVEPVDVLTGGFPCQDLSYAGKGAGIKEGTRSGLWFEYVRAIRALRPRIVIVENVAALLTRGIDVVLGDLAACGFDASWSVLRASDVGAAHRRERLFIVATAADSYHQGLEGRGRQGVSGSVERVVGQGGVTAAEDADVQSGEQRRVAAPRQAEGGRSRAELAGRGRAPSPDSALNGWTKGRTGPSQRSGRGGLPAGDFQAATDASVGGGSDVPVGVDGGRALVGSVAGSGGGVGVGHAASGVRELGRGSGVAWGEFAPAIRRWEHVTGRPAPAPTVDGRLSADFTEWHMGFPPGWTSMLSRNERLKALGNAVVPQCAEVIGRWALGLVGQEVAA